MRLLTWTPGPPLSHSVEVLWVYEAGGGPHAQERLLPDGTMELVIDLREAVSTARAGPTDADLPGGGALLGAQSQARLIQTSAPTAVIGAHFKPGGAFPFLPPPAGEFHGAVVPFQEVWGRTAQDLRERLLEDRRPVARLRILERFLLDRVVRPFAPHPAVAFALGELQAAVPGAATVAEVTDRTGLSQRRFIELFTGQVGLTPKVYFRLRRFQQALRRLETRTTDDLASLALDCGYYDQAHFNHDFKAFSGLSPTAFLAQWAGRPNHVPLQA
jgi:AraC-like DNA-binding protein